MLLALFILLENSYGHKKFKIIRFLLVVNLKIMYDILQIWWVYVNSECFIIVINVIIIFIMDILIIFLFTCPCILINYTKVCKWIVIN
jgi:hypothetical protein